MSLMNAPSWRLMLGVLSIPSVFYFFLTIFFLPESPRWLVSKGRMLEAKKVLQRLRGREDVAGELALLVEGLGVGGDTSIEEYIIGPANDLTDEHDISEDKDQIKIYGPEQGLSWVARPVTGQSTIGLVSRHGSLVNQGSLVDPLVTLFGSVHEKLPETGSMRSTFFPHFGSKIWNNTIRILFSGINGVLYYTPQILEEAGVGVLLSYLGLISSSASLLISGMTSWILLAEGCLSPHYLSSYFGKYGTTCSPIECICITAAGQPF